MIDHLRYFEIDLERMLGHTTDLSYMPGMRLELESERLMPPNAAIIQARCPILDFGQL